MPSAISSSLNDNKLFFGPKHNIYAFFMIQFGLFDLILLFVCQICHVNYETENWKWTKKFKMTTYLKDSLNSNHARLGTIGVGVFRRRRSVVKPWSSLPRSVTSSPFNFRFNKKLGHFTKLTLQQSDCRYLPPSSKVLDGKSFPQRWNILDAPVHTY